MTKRPVALAIALALTTSATLSGCDRTSNLTEQEHIQRAKDFEDKGQLKGSILELKNAIQKNPDSPQARLLLGQVYVKVGMGAEAEKELTKARKLGVSQETIDPQLGEALLLMGEYNRVLDEIQPGEQTANANRARIWQLRADALFKVGQPKEACNLYQQSLDADKNNPSTYRGLAECAIAESDMPKAKEWLDTALKIDPKFTEGLYLKAALLDSESKHEDAAKIYQQILANDPTQFRAHLAIASLQLKKDNMEAADKAIQAAEKLAGKAPMVKYARGTLELQRGNPEKASNSFLEILRVVPNHLPSMLAYAMASYDLGNYEQSIGYAGKVLGAVPDNLIATEILAGSLLKTGDISGAIKTLSPLLPRYPNDAKLMALAGEAYLQAKDYNKAMGYLDRATKLDPKNAAVKTKLAVGHLAGGESDKALAELEQAASLNEKVGQADLALVVLHLQDKEFDKALRVIAALEEKLPNNPATQYLRAMALLGKKDLPGARAALEQTLAIQPTFFPAAVKLANLDLADKKPDAARKRFQALLDKDKNNIHAMLALADLAALEKKENEYLSWLEKAIKTDPKSIKPRAALARYHLAKKENQKALALANEGVNNNPSSLGALNLLGETQLAAGDKAASIATFTRMTQKAPQSPEAFFVLARAQASDKKLVSARVNLQQALKLKPDFLQAEEALMRLELADNKPESALLIARQIQVQQPKSPIGFNNEGDILLVQKKYSQAVKAYEQALARGAQSSTFTNLHHTLLLAGDNNAANQQLSTWIKQNPKDTTVRAYAAEHYMRSNRSRDAIAQYEEVLKLAPQSVLVLNNLAALYQREKDPRALAIAEQAFKLAPENADVLDTLGWILIDKGQLPRATELLSKAATKSPKMATIRFHYGVALARGGKKAEARKELETAIATRQKFPELEDAKTLLRAL